MGVLASCCDASFFERREFNTDYRNEEVFVTGDAQKGTMFFSSDVAQESTPLMKTSDMKMVVMSDSSSNSFDQEMIDKLMAEGDNSDESI